MFSKNTTRKLDSILLISQAKNVNLSISSDIFGEAQLLLRGVPGPTRCAERSAAGACRRSGGRCTEEEEGTTVPLAKDVTGVMMVVTLPETNSSHLKMDGWNTSFLLGWPIFRGYVSFRECSL